MCGIREEIIINNAYRICRYLLKTSKSYKSEVKYNSIVWFWNQIKNQRIQNFEDINFVGPHLHLLFWDNPCLLMPVSDYVLFDSSNCFFFLSSYPFDNLCCPTSSLSVSFIFLIISIFTSSYFLLLSSMFWPAPLQQGVLIELLWGINYMEQIYICN